ncbi:CopD family protein [Herbaspirillum lusitanum]|jgi:uncharacterized membrane protein|uniref:CopD family protein n=1 Tax=Herbaspirillum lusitanum TaxID=213312 RepID=A0ABW9AAM6_9BURK
MLIAKFLHLLGLTIWVGGMFFAHLALRPTAAEVLQGPQRLQLMRGVFARFFPWVWLAVALLLGSGLHMMAQIGKPPVYVSLMAVIGIVMMLIFAHIFFAPFKRLKRAVDVEEWSAAAPALGQIRKLVGINLCLGLLTLLIGSLGPLLH